MGETKYKRMTATRDGHRQGGYITKLYKSKIKAVEHDLLGIGLVKKLCPVLMVLVKYSRLCSDEV